MFQLLEFENLIPSCAIHSLKFDKDENKWIFVYQVNTPIELNNLNNEELVVYEYISDLYVKFKKEMNLQSVNITFKSLDEYLRLLESQRLADINYRKKWCSEHPEEIPNSFVLENRDYTNSELENLEIHFLSSIMKLDNDTTIFSGI